MTFEKYLEIADRSIEIGDFAVAKANYAYARRIKYYDWRVWWGLSRCLTRDFSAVTTENWYKFAVEALSLCKDEESISMMKEKIEAYNENAMAIIENRKKIREMKREATGNEPVSTTWVWIFLAVLGFIILVLAFSL